MIKHNPGLLYNYRLAELIASLSKKVLRNGGRYKTLYETQEEKPKQ